MAVDKMHATLRNPFSQIRKEINILIMTSTFAYFNSLRPSDAYMRR